jgi:hypothetical protein
MNEVKDVSQEDKDLMTQHNIKMETRTVFFSKGYKYDNLRDAVRYAKLAKERERATADS